MHAKVEKYDNVSGQFELLNDSWKKKVQYRIVETEAKQPIINATFNALYHEAEASLIEAHARIADLTAVRGKGTGNKWKLSRPKDIEPSIFGGKEDWAKWKEELEDYADAVHGGLKHALSNTLKISEEVTEDRLKRGGGFEGTEWSKSQEFHIQLKRKTSPLSEARKIIICANTNGYEAWRNLTIRY